MSQKHETLAWLRVSKSLLYLRYIICKRFRRSAPSSLDAISDTYLINKKNRANSCNNLNITKTHDKLTQSSIQEQLHLCSNRLEGTITVPRWITPAEHGYMLIKTELSPERTTFRSTICALLQFAAAKCAGPRKSHIGLLFDNKDTSTPKKTSRMLIKQTIFSLLFFPFFIYFD